MMSLYYGGLSELCKCWITIQGVDLNINKTLYNSLLRTQVFFTLEKNYIEKLNGGMT